MSNPKFQYWFFIIITICYFLILHQFLDVTFAKVKVLPVNELGDFLAGTFSPLAFLFLILGYLQTNKSLGQNSEAIAQQAEAIKQQALSLQMQAQELKISNESLKRQVEEMSKSVKAQQDMFYLAEQQYQDTKVEKAELNRPKLIFLGSNYSQSKEYNDAYYFRFNLTIKNTGISIKDISLQSNFWIIMLDKGGSLDNQIKTISCPTLEKGEERSFFFYKKTNVVPFQNNTLQLSYKDINGNKYNEAYLINKTSNSDFIEVVKIEHG